MSTADTDSLADLPPSAKLVHKVFEDDDDSNHQQTGETSRLPARTVRGALGTLETTGSIEKRRQVSDARVRLYRSQQPGDADSP